jgi:type IV secretory pathway VirB10-like protein
MNMASRARGAMSRRSKLVRPALVAVALVATAGLGLLVSGCGGSSSEGVAQIATTDTTTSTGADSQSGSSKPSPTAYSACMRSNGVPSFPDPDAEGNFPNLDLEHSPAVEAARDACEPLRPPRRELSPADRAQARRLQLAYSRCMREHGVENFPDEKPTAADRINPDSPAFKAADRACNHFLRDVPGD